LWYYLFCWVVDVRRTRLPRHLVVGTGTGGSLARFTIVGNYLYALSVSTLNVFDISDPAEPKLESEVGVGNDVETIFPFGDWLFLGTQSGMLIYRIENDGLPTFVSEYEHVVSCDPVVTDGQTAFVTLRASQCRQAGFGAADLLESISLDDITNPVIIGQRQMTAPRGLGLDGDVLFVCDSEGGLWVFDVSVPDTFVEIVHIDDIVAYDVIPLDGVLLVLGPENIYQYDYTNLPTMTPLSELALN
jgi:hypothetical protein